MHESPSLIRFGVIGINHGHIYGMVKALLRGRAELVRYYAPEPELNKPFAEAFPQARRTTTKEEILEDETLQLVATSGINDERAPLGIQVMQHGKDFLTDKPGVTTLEQLAEVRLVQSKTRQIYSICFSERLENKATTKAGELVALGVIGKVIQTIGLGPHRMNPASRPDWFFRKSQYGGILCDIASHQFDQFLFFSGSISAEVITSQVGNFNHPQFPELEDFGDAIVRGNDATGYLRVDWFTPTGLPVWGDGRLFILGTEGYIEIRKYIDLDGRTGADHLFLVNNQGPQYIDCSDVELSYGPQLVQDVLDRTEKALPQAHVFLASELALKAEAQAKRVGPH